MKEKRKVTLAIAIVPVIFLVAGLIFVLTTGLQEPHVPLLASAIFAAIYAMAVIGTSWRDIEEGIADVIKMSANAIIIMLVIGIVIGTWVASGIVPAMIYYGLKILSPGIFLVATLIMCSIVSLATGAAWTTMATIGVALMGVGHGLGIDAPLIGGAIISGAYFGDKMSPLSDTTNLAPSVAGSNLFDHIRHMVFTTGPSYVVTLIFFGIMGMKYAGKDLDASVINGLLDAISNTFNVTPLLMSMPILVILMVVFKVPALPGLFGGAVLGGLAMMAFQGYSLYDVFQAMQNGVVTDPDGWGVYIDSGNPVINELIGRGGMQGMNWVISMILCAMAFGGIMEKTGMLRAISSSILKLANSTGNLVLATVFSCFTMNIIGGDQYLSIVIPGRMYKEEYEKRGLAPENLSRILEDAGTLTSPLVPWSSCGAFVVATLGLAPITYIPFCILNLLNPVLSIIYGYTGLTMKKIAVREESTSEESAQ